MSDATNPGHYTQGEVECIDALRSALGLEGFKGFCQGNAIKYLWRYQHKGRAIEDLRKSEWYLDRLKTACAEPKHRNYDPKDVAVKSQGVESKGFVPGDHVSVGKSDGPEQEVEPPLDTRPTCEHDIMIGRHCVKCPGGKASKL